MESVIKQEVGTMFLFENFPTNLPPQSSVYLESGNSPTFTQTDTKAAHWGYSRPGLNMRDDKDDGWELKWRKNESGILIPCEERLLLNGVEYKPILIPGDFDSNNKVDSEDFFLFADAFGTQNELYDLNYNGQVDFDDFFMFADNFGRVRQLPNV